MRITFAKPETYTCSREGCSETYTDGGGVQGSYCSSKCANVEAGAKVLNAIRHDHRLCSSCFRLKKDVETPTDDYRRRFTLLLDQAVTGYESVTDTAEYGPYGVECICGAIDAEAAWIRDDHAFHWYLQCAVDYLREQGRFDYHLDAPTVADALWEGADLELAVGRALADT